MTAFAWMGIGAFIYATAMAALITWLYRAGGKREAEDRRRMEQAKGGEGITIISSLGAILGAFIHRETSRAKQARLQREDRRVRAIMDAVERGLAEGFDAALRDELAIRRDLRRDQSAA